MGERSLAVTRPEPLRSCSRFPERRERAFGRLIPLPDGLFRSDFLVVKHSNEYRRSDGSTYKPPVGSGAAPSGSLAGTGR